MRHYLFLIASAFALLACAPAPTVTETAAATAKATPGPTGPAMWLLQDHDTRIYLFGTIHALPADAHWYRGPVAQAFDAADTVVLEVTDFNDVATVQQAVIRYAPANDGQPLSTKLGEQQLTNLAAIAAHHGVPLAALETMDPWFVLFTLSVMEMQTLGYDPRDGVEMQIVERSAQRDVQLTSLETSVEQLAIMDALPAAAQIDWLAYTLTDWDEMQSDLDSMYRAWQVGDDQGLAELMNDALLQSPEVYGALLTDRNARWATWLAARLGTPGTVFVAVGAGHLAGSDSVQHHLRRLGLATTRVH